MAIPFHIPSDEETENNYRSMDDLLLQLYRVLRQILMHRVPAEEVNDQHRHGRVAHHQDQAGRHEVDAVPPPDVIPRLPLPDVVSCAPAPQVVAPTPSHPRPPPRRGRRRRLQRRHDREPTEAATPEKVAVAEVEAPEVARGKVEVRDNWTQVGEDLRQIADDFGASLVDIDQKRLDTSSNQKGIGLSFLSLLVPPPFKGSIWMAVIFLFGWGALHRSR